MHHVGVGPLRQSKGDGTWRPYSKSDKGKGIPSESPAGMVPTDTAKIPGKELVTRLTCVKRECGHPIRTPS